MRYLKDTLFLRSIILFLLLIVTSTSVFATIRYVKPGAGSGTAPYDTWAKASGDLQGVINYCSGGDEIYVSSGTINLGATITWNKNIDIYGGFYYGGTETPSTRIKPESSLPWVYSNATILKGTGGFRLLLQSSVLNNKSVDGFTLDNGGSVSEGAGVKLDNGGTLTNCIVQNCSASNGGGVKIPSGAIVKNSLIINNTATSADYNDGGGGVLITDGAKLANSYITNNHSNSQGGGVYIRGNNGTAALIVNCVISNNHADIKGGGLLLYKSGDIINSTVVRNQASSGSNGKGIYTIDALNGHIYNSVFWQNKDDNGSHIVFQGDKPYVSNCAEDGSTVYATGSFRISGTNNAKETGEISLYHPPYFISPTSSTGKIAGMTSATIGDWNISPNSVLIDEGNTTYCDESSDLVGQTRKVNAIDIGAYEIQITVIESSDINITNSSVVYNGSGQSPTITITPIVTYTIEYKVKDAAASTYTTTKPVNVGNYDVRVTVTQSGYSGSTTGSLTINQKLVTVSAAAVEKNYDAAITANIPTLTLSEGSGANQVLTADWNSVAAAGTAATYDSKIIGTGKTVTITGVTLSGSRSANYSVASSATNTASSITARELTITGISAVNKAYDATTSATLSGTATLNNKQGSDVVTLGNSTTNTFAQSNSGTSITVTTAYTISGADAGNYILKQPSLTANITKAPLSVSFGAVTKEYNGNNTATVPALTVSGAQGGETITATATGATYDSKSVGTAKTVSLTGIVFTAPRNDNYSLSSTASNTLGVITARDVAASLTITFPNQSKIYDGNTDVVAIAVDDFSISGIVGSDVVSVSSYTTASYDDEDVSINKTVTVSGLAFTGADASNYSLPESTTNTTSRITQKDLSITVNSSQNKVYGVGNPTYTYTPSGLVSGETFTGALTRVSGENVGNYAIRIGTLAPSTPSNYNISFTSSNFEITQKELTISGAASNSKTYDGSDVAIISGGDLNGLVGSDAVSFSVSATFDNKNVGTGKSISATFSLTGGTVVNNYSLTQPTGFTADVTTRELEIVGFSIKDRAPIVGDFSAQVDSWGILQTIPTSDAGNVTVKTTGVTATFPSDGAGTHTVSLSVIELEGSEKSNYTLKQPSGDALKATISNALPTFDWSAQNLTTTYNGAAYPVSVTETHNATNATIEYDHGDGNSWVATVPIDAGNYSVRATSTDATYSGNETKTLTINKKTILAATFPDDGTKIFDNSTNVSPQPSLTLAGIEARDIATVSASGDAAKYDNVNVGTNKTVTIKNVKLSGDGSANYSIPSSATNSTWEITKLDYNTVPLVFSFPSQSKVFDGTASVKKNGTEVIPTITITGFLAGNSFTATASSATYDSPQTGTGKTVTLSGITYSDNATANYTLPTTLSNALGEITKLSITDLGASVTLANQNKVYDGTTDVKDGAGTVYVPALTVSGLVADFQAVTAAGLSAVYDNKNVGANDKSVTVSGITYAGADKDNYTFPSEITNTTSSITPLDVDDVPELEVVFDAQTKVYDGTIDVKNLAETIYVPALSINGLLGSDDVTAIATSASYDNKNVGANNKTITVENITYTGVDVANYTFPSTVLNTTSSITPLDVDDLVRFEVVFDAQSKVYDGTTRVKDGSGSTYVPSLTINGLVGTDVVTASGGTATYDTKDVGTNDKTVTVGAISYGGADVANYTLPAAAVNTVSSITPLDVEDLAGFEVAFDAQSKVYDGTTRVKDASGIIYVPELTINGLVGTDVVTASGSTATYDTKDVGANDKTVTVGTITYGGADVANYTLPATVVNAVSSITPLDVDDLVGFEVVFDTQSKIYDGTAVVKNAVGNAYIPTLTVNGLLAGDLVTAIATKAIYDNKNAGTNKTITVSDIIYSGVNMSNYVLPLEVSQLNNIVIRKSILITPLQGQEKYFDDNVMYLDFDVNPERLDNLVLIKDELTGKLGWAGSNALGTYEINQGTLTSANNGNYAISFTQKVNFVIASNINIIRKWGYMLLVDNADDAFRAYQWYRDGVALNGETNQYYANENKILCGVYSCDVTLVDGTKIMSPDYEFKEDCGKLKSVTLYPNPVKSQGNFYLERDGDDSFNTESTEYMIEVFNTQGQLIDRKKVDILDKVKLDAPALSGVYFIRVLLNNKELQVIRVLVVN